MTVKEKWRPLILRILMWEKCQDSANINFPNGESESVLSFQSFLFNMETKYMGTTMFESVCQEIWTFSELSSTAEAVEKLMFFLRKAGAQHWAPKKWVSEVQRFLTNPMGYQPEVEDD